MILAKLWQMLFPLKFRIMVRRIRLYPQIMLKYNHGENKRIYAKEIAYIKKDIRIDNSIMLLGDFMSKANAMPTEVFFDDDKQLPYVIDNSKRLYFKKGTTSENVRTGYNGLVGEQDVESPHRYVDDTFYVSQDSTLFDIGSAEAIFALRNIDVCKKVVLFECDEEWVEALEATFEPYKEKVEIVKKYVSDTNDADNITIDEYIKRSGNTPNFIKMDIEGFEQKCLLGMNETLNNAKELKMAVCAYHSIRAEQEIREILDKYNCKIRKSDGYMLETMGISPTFVTAVLRIEMI